MTHPRYIWICGPSACGKTTFTRDAEALERYFGIKPPYLVRESCHSARLSDIRQAEEEAWHTPLRAVVQIWQWRSHPHMLEMLQTHRPRPDIVLLKPHLVDWVHWHQDKYHPISPGELMERWDKVEQRFAETVGDYRVIQLPRQETP